MLSSSQTHYQLNAPVFFKAITSYSFLFISFFVIEIYSIISRKKHIINVRTVISDYFIGGRLFIKPVRAIKNVSILSDNV